LEAQPAQPKLIQVGFENPNSSDLLEHLKTIESNPFDGVVLMLTGQDDAGQKVFLHGTFNRRAWKREWFAKNIEELQAVKSAKLTDNFVRVGSNPGDVDWFDDEGWKQVVDHWRTAAWVARQGRLKGIVFDPEPYNPPHAQFKFAAQIGKDKHTFAEYTAKARQRGREVMEAIAAEYPSATLLTFFMNSYNVAAATQQDQQAALQNAPYGLYPAFINGWLDVAPPTITFVDGNENAYFYNSEVEFLRAANDICHLSLPLIAPENRTKYKLQVETGAGIYLDAYVNPQGSIYYIEPLNGSRGARLYTNLKHAVATTDKYIWVYGEKYRWFPTKTPKVSPQSWDEVLPGASDALRSVAQPDHWFKTAQLRFDAAEKLTPQPNLLINGDFGTAKADAGSTAPQADWQSKGVPPGWSTWQAEAPGRKPGTFSWDAAMDHTGKASSGAVCIAGVSTGVYISSFAVKPGELYLIRAQQQLALKSSVGSIRIRWQSADNKWVAVSQDAFIKTPKDAKPGEWNALSGIVQVPADAAKLLVMLGAENQNTPEDRLWYDDVEAYKVP
jgi:hypothetical protein